jgi:NAD(P)-dependent dehydrogenase (short-subunit alcohol dehydrogenase family)
MRLSGKVVFVTGAASGIGRATALRCGEEGAAVAVTDRDASRGRETVELLRKKGGDAAFFSLDATSEQQWADVAGGVLRRFHRIDALVNNAGVYRIRSLIDTTVEDWNLMMDVNAKGVFLGMRAVAPIMGEAGGGAIVNMSSTTALTGIAGRTAYAATKAAVRVMTKCVAVEYAPVQVRVNSVHPGFVRTGIAEYGARVAGKSVDDLGRMVTPLGRIAEVEDVANMCLFLASDEARHITGAEFVVDGGLTAGPDSPSHVSPLAGRAAKREQ